MVPRQLPPRNNSSRCTSWRVTQYIWTKSDRLRHQPTKWSCVASSTLKPFLEIPLNVPSVGPFLSKLLLLLFLRSNRISVTFQSAGFQLPQQAKIYSWFGLSLSGFGFLLRCSIDYFDQSKALQRTSEPNKFIGSTCDALYSLMLSSSLFSWFRCPHHFSADCPRSINFLDAGITAVM